MSNSPKDVGKVWEVILKNEKCHIKKELKKLKRSNNVSNVTRKIVPLFVDDDNKVIEREKIINMHNVFLKETKHEYSNEHMNDLFNFLFENKTCSKKNKVYSSVPQRLVGSEGEFYLPSIKNFTPSNRVKSKFQHDIVFDSHPEVVYQDDSIESEIEEKIKNDIINRNKLVITLRKFPLSDTKIKKKEKQERPSPRVTFSDSKVFSLIHYKNNLNQLKRYHTNISIAKTLSNFQMNDPQSRNKMLSLKLSLLHSRNNTEGVNNNINKCRSMKGSNSNHIRIE